MTFPCAYQPADAATEAWTEERCVYKEQLTRLSRVVRCKLPAAKVARGVRLQIQGHPSLLEAIELETAAP